MGNTVSRTVEAGTMVVWSRRFGDFWWGYKEVVNKI